MKDASVYVYLSNAKIQVLVGDYSKNKLVVEQFYEQELEEGAILNGIIMNSYSLQNALSEMWKAHSLPTKAVTLVVNGSSITVKPMSIPQVAPKNVLGLIRTEFKDLDNIQNLLIDYSVVNQRNADGSCGILAVLSTKDFIMSYINLFREAKIEIGVMDLVQNCLIKLMKRLKALQNKTYAVFVLDKSTLMQLLFSNNNFVMIRRSRILADPQDADFEREVGQNINSIIQFNKSEQTGADITDLYLCGFPDGIADLFPKFSENFGVHVEAFPALQPNELTLPQNMNPSEFIVLLGSMIRYSL